MPRPCKCRRISPQPHASAFKPAGVPGRDLQQIELGLDELEALRLADLEGLYHDAAAERMGVSRPTFGRLVARARHKVASALLQSKMLVITGGPIEMRTMRAFDCTECGARFEVPYGGGRPVECPSCHGGNFHRAIEDQGGGFVAAVDAEATMSGTSGPGRGRGRCRRRRAGWPHGGGGGGCGGGTGGVFRIVEPLSDLAESESAHSVVGDIAETTQTSEEEHP